jgi:hypothetical protein
MSNVSIKIRYSFGRTPYPRHISTRRRQQDPLVHTADVGVPAKGHREVQFFLDDLQAVRDTGLAHRTQPVEEAAADQRALGAERDGC